MTGIPSGQAASDLAAEAIPQQQTPYELTLAGLAFPLLARWAFDAFSGLCLALAGAPRMAVAWALAMCAADAGLQAIYSRMARTAAGAESDKGLRRLAGLTLARTILSYSAPVAFTVIGHSEAGLAISAITILSLTTLGVALGWTSRAMFAATVAPGVAAFGIMAFALFGPAQGTAVFLALGSFSLTLALIAMGTHKAVSGWAQANSRTAQAMIDMQEALRRSEDAERRFRMAAEITHLHLFEVDFAKKTVTSQGAGSQDFFRQPLTFAGFAADPFSFVAEADRPRIRAAWDAYAAGGPGYRVQCRTDRDGEDEVWVSAGAEIIRGPDGRTEKVVCVMHEITDLKRTELDLIDARDRAEAGSRAKSDFLATMSHEIRTPLNGVLGMAQAMGRDRLSAVQRQRLDVIRRSGESLLVLLNSVLDLSKIEAGKLELEVGEVDIAAVARTALDAFAAQAQDKGVALALEIAPEADGVYAGDAARVGQILTNLIANAVKFTDEGSVRLGVAATDAGLRLTVTDTGIGISATQQIGLFDKFVQADASTTRRYGGTGLGLSISQQLARMMGGEIDLESAPGRGSTFTVLLPLPRLAGPAARAAAPVAAPAGADLSQVRVLAAEDNPVNQLVLATLLQQFGIAPTVVSDGGQAVAAWRTADWDLILMDVQMPVMDGLTATGLIRAEEAGTGRRRTPIVALTANVMSHQLDDYRAAGMDEVVAKPIEVASLLRAMAAVMADGEEGAGAAGSAAA